MTEASVPEHDFPQARDVPAKAPLGWLREGWRDLRRSPWAFLPYGAAFALMGGAFWITLARHPEILLGLVTGFMLMGPFVALGTYDVARQLEDGKPARLLPSLTAWRANLPSIGFMVMILVLLMASWVRVTVVLVALAFTGNLPTQADLLQPDFYLENAGFVVAYVLVGAAFAVLAFSVSVVSIPLLMERRIDAISAIIASLIACFRNPAAMLVWGGLIAFLVVIGMVTGFLGLIVTGPWLGAATWHAYRALLA